MLLTGFDPLLIKRCRQRWIVENLLLSPAQSGDQTQVIGQRMPLSQLLQTLGA